MGWGMTFENMVSNEHGAAADNAVTAASLTPSYVIEYIYCFCAWFVSLCCVMPVVGSYCISCSACTIQNGTTSKSSAGLFNMKTCDALTFSVPINVHRTR